MRDYAECLRLWDPGKGMSVREPALEAALQSALEGLEPSFLTYLTVRVGVRELEVYRELHRSEE